MVENAANRKARQYYIFMMDQESSGGVRSEKMKISIEAYIVGGVYASQRGAESCTVKTQRGSRDSFRKSGCGAGYMRQNNSPQVWVWTRRNTRLLDGFANFVLWMTVYSDARGFWGGVNMEPGWVLENNLGSDIVVCWRKLDFILRDLKSRSLQYFFFLQIDRRHKLSNTNIKGLVWQFHQICQTHVRTLSMFDPSDISNVVCYKAIRQLPKL